MASAPARPGEHRRQADLAGQAEDAVLARLAQVGVDDQRALAHLREQHGQVGGDVAAAFAGAGADDGERGLRGVVLEPAQHQLRAQAAQVLDGRAVRLVRGDQVLAQAGIRRQAGVAELQGERLAHVLVGEQAHRDARLAERQADLLLVVVDALGLVAGDAAGVHQQRADRLGRFPRRPDDVEVAVQRKDLAVHARLPR
jgi:hypothetical protein